jgi:hypothetical protein
MLNSFDEYYYYDMKGKDMLTPRLLNCLFIMGSFRLLLKRSAIVDKVNYLCENHKTNSEIIPNKLAFNCFSQ